jgi:hypothetical protein
MSLRKVLVGGKTFITSRDAAFSVGLSATLISNLARAGLIAAHLVKGQWFVDPDSLKEFIVQQEREKSAL